MEKQKLLKVVENGGWSALSFNKVLRFGDFGDEVVYLRNRLFDQGYISNSLSTKFNIELLKECQEFQSVHS